jgi:hypothetical protein
LGSFDLFRQSHNLYGFAELLNKVQESQRNPTDACHTKASSKKKKGLPGRRSIIQPKAYKASGSWASGVPWETTPVSRRCALGS